MIALLPRRVGLFLIAAAAVAITGAWVMGERGASRPAPSWKVVYTRNDGGLGFWTSTQRRLVTLTGVPGRGSGIFDERPVWSPDGNYVAFSRAPAERGIYVVRVGREPPRRVLKTFPDSSGSWSVWSPNGRRIAVSITCDSAPDEKCPWGATALYTIDSDGSHVQKLVALLSDARREPRIGGVVWSPDGRQIAYIVNEWTSCCRDALYTIGADGGIPSSSQRRAILLISWRHPAGLRTAG